MISVIVTVYNKELYIKNTLFSIFNQDIPPEEIIIIDDGSTDNSLKIINNLELPKSATVFSINNSGVSAARNFGIEKSKCSYLYFVDGDDLLEKNAISNFLHEINKNKNYGIYAANRKTNNGLLKVRDISDKQFDINEYFQHIIESQNLCWTSAVVINKKLLGKIKFDKKFSHGEDRDFFIRILQRHNGNWIDKVVAIYVSDPNGLSSGTINKKQDLFWQRLNEHHFKNHLLIKSKAFKLKYCISNIIQNLKKFEIKNAISWLI